MMDTRRITVDVDEKVHRDAKSDLAKQGLSISDAIRAFLRAFIKKDDRAKQIVNEYSDKK